MPLDKKLSQKEAPNKGRRSNSDREMIPNELIQLIEMQPGDIHRTDKRSVTEALTALDIGLDSELSEFF